MASAPPTPPFAVVLVLGEDVASSPPVLLLSLDDDAVLPVLLLLAPTVAVELAPVLEADVDASPPLLLALELARALELAIEEEAATSSPPVAAAHGRRNRDGSPGAAARRRGRRRSAMTTGAGRRGCAGARGSPRVRAAPSPPPPELEAPPVPPAPPPPELEAPPVPPAPPRLALEVPPAPPIPPLPPAPPMASGGRSCRTRWGESELLQPTTLVNIAAARTKGRETPQNTHEKNSWWGGGASLVDSRRARHQDLHRRRAETWIRVASILRRCPGWSPHPSPRFSTTAWSDRASSRSPALGARPWVKPRVRRRLRAEASQREGCSQPERPHPKARGAPRPLPRVGATAPRGAASADIFATLSSVRNR